MGRFNTERYRGSEEFGKGETRNRRKKLWNVGKYGDGGRKGGGKEGEGMW